eukprot:349750-Chlamydomonas_euryale.AAC.3
MPARHRGTPGTTSEVVLEAVNTSPTVPELSSTPMEIGRRGICVDLRGRPGKGPMETAPKAWPLPPHTHTPAHTHQHKQHTHNGAPSTRSTHTQHARRPQRTVPSMMPQNLRNAGYVVSAALVVDRCAWQAPAGEHVGAKFVGVHGLVGVQVGAGLVGVHGHAWAYGRACGRNCGHAYPDRGGGRAAGGRAGMRRGGVGTLLAPATAAKGRRRCGMRMLLT